MLHIGTEGSEDERLRLSWFVRSVGVIKAFGNVDVIGKPDVMTYMGASNVAASLRAAAIFLKVGGDWDWFVTLSAAIILCSRKMVYFSYYMCIVIFTLLFD